jgi:hypothetical protein
MNIIERLSECKKGTKLYSPQLGELVFDGIMDDRIIAKSSWNVFFQFDNNGKCYLFDNSIAELYPSEENKDWNKMRNRSLVGEAYYYVSSLGNVLPTIESNSNNDTAMFNCGNYFTTEQEAMSSKLYNSFIRQLN